MHTTWWLKLTKVKELLCTVIMLMLKLQNSYKNSLCMQVSPDFILGIVAGKHSKACTSFGCMTGSQFEIKWQEFCQQGKPKKFWTKYAFLNFPINNIFLSQGSYRSWKTWKVMEFYNFIFQAWKVLKFRYGSWKVIENQYVFF